MRKKRRKQRRERKDDERKCSSTDLHLARRERVDEHSRGDLIIVTKELF